MSKRRLKIHLPVVSNKGEKINILEIETVFNDGTFGGGRRYSYHVSSIERGVSETGTPYTAFSLCGAAKSYGIEPATRFNARRLEQLHAEASKQVAARSGIVWDMVSEVLSKDDLTLVSNEPIAA